MASTFKAKCLALLDQVAMDHVPIVVTKRGQPEPVVLSRKASEAIPLMHFSIAPRASCCCHLLRKTGQYAHMQVGHVTSRHSGRSAISETRSLRERGV